MRKQFSELASVPAYVVFSDATLADMLSRKPLTLAAMSEVSGVGEHKLDRYGDDFVGLIREHVEASEGASA